MTVYEGFVGGSYQSQSPNADDQRAVNWYVERIESGDGKSKAALYPTPGSKVFSIPTAASQVGISSVQVSRAGTTFGAISTVEVKSYDTEASQMASAVNGSGGSGVASYSASPNYTSATVNSTGGTVSDVHSVGGWPSIVTSGVSVSVQANLDINLSHAGAGSSASIIVKISKDSGSTYATVATYNFSSTPLLNVPISGVANLNTLRFQVTAQATAGVGGDASADVNVTNIAASVSGVSPWTTTFTGGLLTEADESLGANATSNNLVCTQSTFGLPSGRTIKGVQLSFNINANVTTVSTNQWKVTAQLLYNGSVIGTAKSYSQAATATGLTVTLGSSSDLWGATITDDMVSDPSFGFNLQVQSTTTSGVSFQVTSIQLTVQSTGDYYAVFQIPSGVPFSVGDSVIPYSLTNATWLNGQALVISDITGNFATAVFDLHPSAYPQTSDTGWLYNLVSSYALVTTATTNPFSVGANITLASLTNSANTWLNGYSAIIAAEPSTTTFAVPVTHADYGPVSDSGIAFIGAVTSTPAVRAQYSLNGARHFAISLGNLYETFSDGTFVSRGNVSNDGKPASITANVNQLLIASGGLLYLYNLATNVLTNVPNYNNATPLPAISLVDYCDGYFIALVANSQKFLISAILDGSSWDPLDVAVVSVFPDNVVSLKVDHREIWLQGSSKTVVYYDSGNANFPFDVVPGSFIDEGAAAAQATVRLDNSLFWIGQDDRGGRMAWRTSGYTPIRISTHAVEFAWSQYSTVSDAVAYGYQDQGHAFYVIYFPTANATWVYDAATGLWHERAFWNGASYDAHRSQNHAYCFGKHLVGDWATGIIYDMNIAYYDDFGNTIRRLRTGPIVSNEMQWLYFSAFQVDAQPGIGLQSGQGSDPQIVMQYSDDDGMTWSDELSASAGAAGKYRTRIIWRRLGRSRNRIFRVIATDPVPWRIVAAYLELS